MKPLKLLDGEKTVDEMPIEQVEAMGLCLAACIEAGAQLLHDIEPARLSPEDREAFDRYITAMGEAKRLFDRAL
jgi:hypothetical protein